MDSLVYSFFAFWYPRQELSLQFSGPQTQSCAGPYGD
jgi:hypothetical protein